MSHYAWTGVAAIHGVPARDLTMAEAAAFADVITQQQLLTGLIIYRLVTDEGADNAPDEFVPEDVPAMEE